jgi:glycosyltransferase involved in cell wall biosynthesis
VLERLMRLLILSFYFPPDLCAGSFRCEALVDAIAASRPETLEVDVITTTPNRYQSMNMDAAEFEDHGWLTVRRVSVPKHKSGMADQSKVFFAYARGALAAIKGRKYDAVFATSSRLMTAVLGAKAARNLNAPLYLDIRDLFVDTMGDILNNSPLKLLMPAFGMLEGSTFAQARRINIVSPGFAKHLGKVAPKSELRTFTNGIDAEFLDYNYAKAARNDPPLILYAGNIGEGQGLHRIIPEVAFLLRGHAELKIVGDGGKLEDLRAALSLDADHVTLLPPVPRTKLHQHYCEADILFIHLNDHQAFHKVLPSKIFEYAATGKPIIAGVAGISADFLRAEVPGCFVFDPCDFRAMASAVADAIAVQQPIDRTAFLNEYARTTIMNAMAQDVIAFTREGGALSDGKKPLQHGAEIPH